MSRTSMSVLERAAMRKVYWRIIPFCVLLYVIAYVDRANIGYAALQMNEELALTTEAFGFAAGIFFIGYILFEVPSNVLLLRFGPRIWIGRILVTWGAVAVLSAFVQSALQLFVLRFLLGVAEAGFFPGIIIYLTYWFRDREQATTVALFTAAIPLSYVIGAPLSTFIMDHVSGLGLSGWRWMLIIEGLPAMLGGLATFLFLTDRPADARWLRPEERGWLSGELAREAASRRNVRHLGTLQAITDAKVLYLSAIYFVYQCGSLGVGYWMPQAIKGFSGTLTNFQVGLVATVPYALATIVMVLWSRHSDRTGERRLHTALPLLLAAATLSGLTLTASPALSLVLVSAALTGLYAFKAPFWSLPGLFLSRATAAVSIAAINSIGNLGGFVGPYIIGAIKARTRSPGASLLFLAVLVLIAFAMVCVARLENRDGREATESCRQI